MPKVDPETGNWMFYNPDTREWEVSDFSSIGDEGHSPIIQVDERDGHRYWYEYAPSIGMMKAV